MVFIEFFILGAIVVFGSIKLAGQAEVIEDNSKMNAAIIGIILALTTSLPELATGLTSAAIGQPEMAIGNVLGSNAFNFLILSLVNIIFFSKVIMSNVKHEAARLNIFTGLMYVIFLASYYGIQASGGQAIIILNRLTLSSIAILVVYFIAIKVTSGAEEEESDEEHVVDEAAYRRAKINFVALAAVILIASIFLAKSAEQIVELTGLSASVVGAIFIGISTSLPELMTCFSLAKNDKFTMAATSIWGSCLFNFLILTIIDMFASKPLMTAIDSDLLGLAFLGLIFGAIHFGQTIIGSKNKVINIVPSIIMIAMYFGFFVF